VAIIVLMSSCCAEAGVCGAEEETVGIPLGVPGAAMCLSDFLPALLPPLFLDGTAEGEEWLEDEEADAQEEEEDGDWMQESGELLAICVVS